MIKHASCGFKTSRFITLTLCVESCTGITWVWLDEYLTHYYYIFNLLLQVKNVIIYEIIIVKYLIFMKKVETKY
jgi:hypothetical protein